MYTAVHTVVLTVNSKHTPSVVQCTQYTDNPDYTLKCQCLLTTCCWKRVELAMVWVADRREWLKGHLGVVGGGWSGRVATPPVSAVQTGTARILLIGDDDVDELTAGVLQDDRSSFLQS